MSERWLNTSITVSLLLISLGFSRDLSQTLATKQSIQITGGVVIVIILSVIAAYAWRII